MAKKKTVKKKPAKKKARKPKLTHKHIHLASKLRAAAKKSKGAADAKLKAAKAIEKRRMAEAAEYAERADKLAHESHQATRSLYQQVRDFVAGVLK